MAEASGKKKKGPNRGESPLPYMWVQGSAKQPNQRTTETMPINTVSTKDPTTYLAWVGNRQGGSMEAKRDSVKAA